VLPRPHAHIFSAPNGVDIVVFNCLSSVFRVLRRLRVTELNVRGLSPVSVMTLIANCLLELPAIPNTCCIRPPPP